MRTRPCGFNRGTPTSRPVTKAYPVRRMPAVSRRYAATATGAKPVYEARMEPARPPVPHSTPARTSRMVPFRGMGAAERDERAGMKEDSSFDAEKGK